MFKMVFSTLLCMQFLGCFLMKNHYNCVYWRSLVLTLNTNISPLSMVTVSKFPSQMSGASWSERAVGRGLWVGLTGGTQGLVGCSEGLVVFGWPTVVVGSGSAVVVNRVVVGVAWVMTVSGGPVNTKP